MTKIKCLKCGDVLKGDGKGTLIQCKCKSTYIDETDYYCRIGGYPKEYRFIEHFNLFKKMKQKKEKVKNYEKEIRRKKGNSNKSDKD